MYEESIQAIADEVATAEQYVHVEYFILCWDSTTHAVLRCPGRRVGPRGEGAGPVRPSLHLRIPGYKEMLAKLDQAAIEWHPMLPLRPLKGEWRRPDLRNHRKIVVVDGRSAFCGSQNMIDSSYHNKKHEAAAANGANWSPGSRARSSSPSISSSPPTGSSRPRNGSLAEVRAVEFPAGNGDMTCQVVPSGPGFPNENNLKLFNLLIYGAQRRLSITSPYFVPDESLLYAITTAAQRGVAVELFVGAQGDQFMVHHAQCSYYRRCSRPASGSICTRRRSCSIPSTSRSTTTRQ